MAKNYKVEVRCTEKEKNKIKWLSQRYGYETVSQLILHATLNVKRKKIKKEDLKSFIDKRA